MGKKQEKLSDKGGRPRIYEGEMKMRSLRFPVDEWAQWHAAAEAEGISLTQWIVNACRKAARPTRRRKGG